MPPTVIDLEDEADRWEWRCPNGHTAWEAVNHHWYCTSCARAHDDVDPVFRYLRSARTGARLERHDAVLMTETGPMKPRAPAD